MKNFEALSIEQFKKLLKDSNGETCELDPISKKIVLEHKEIFLPIIREINNKSIILGDFPNDELK